MGILTPLLVLTLVIRCVPGSTTLQCRQCDNLVSSPNECTTIRNCHSHCLTEVYRSHHKFSFKYSCVHRDECLSNHVHHTDMGSLVCRECCQTTGCELNSCHRLVLKANLSMSSTIAAQSPSTTVPALATALPITRNIVTQAPPTQLPCVDHDDPAFTCADMIHFNYCDPTSGSGYALAQQRCRKSCGFCH